MILFTVKSYDVKFLAVPIKMSWAYKLEMLKKAMSISSSFFIFL